MEIVDVADDGPDRVVGHLNIHSVVVDVNDILKDVVVVGVVELLHFTVVTRNLRHFGRLQIFVYLTNPF